MEGILRGDVEAAGRMLTESSSDGTTVQWGEFQGTGRRGREGAQNVLQEWWAEDSWEAFRDCDNEETDTHGTPMSQHDGQWWCEDSTVLCTGPTHQPIDTSRLDQVFESCFPSHSLPVIEDYIKPLNPLLCIAGGHSNSPHTRLGSCFLGAACDQQVQCKFEASRLHNSYLSSLHIDPHDKITPHKAKFLTTSPALKEKQQSHRMGASVTKEAELKLMKVASVSVHVSGFSPCHHLQSLFQHWSPAQGKPRLKLAYELKRSLLV
ncbi:uncharacterized protein RCH25_043090 [Pelodytes ibericus]